MQKIFESLLLRDNKRRISPKDAQKGHPARPVQFSLSLFRGVVEAALYCAHRTSTFLSCAFCEQEGHLAAPPLLADFFSIRTKGYYPSGRVERKTAPSWWRRSSQGNSSTRTAYLRVQFG